MLIALVVAAIIAIFSILIYNSMVRLRVRSANAWSDIDVQLKRRWDLVPALVTTVKGYAKHERETFEEVTRARSNAMGAGKIRLKGLAEQTLAAQIGRLFAVAEQYPELKASGNFLELGKQLVEVEDTLQNARRYYNAVVRDFNTLIQQFPHVVVARLADYKPLEYFQLDSDAERNAVQVEVDNP